MRINGIERVTQNPKSALLFLIIICIVFKGEHFWAQSECLVYNSFSKQKMIRKDRKQSAAGSILQI